MNISENGNEPLNFDSILHTRISLKGRIEIYLYQNEKFKLLESTETVALDREISFLSLKFKKAVLCLYSLYYLQITSIEDI